MGTEMMGEDDDYDGMVEEGAEKWNHGSSHAL